MVGKGQDGDDAEATFYLYFPPINGQLEIDRLPFMATKTTLLISPV